jgi:transposase-like protein
MSLEKAKNSIEEPPIVMPVCPYCKTEMTPFDYRGYYDSFVGWECLCAKIPNAEKQTGRYA